MKNLKARLQNLKTKAVALGTAVTGGLIAGSAYAADHSTAISAAGADGVTNTSAAVVALVGIVAVVVGVGFVISVLRKS